jgi:hypothetical protein
VDPIEAFDSMTVCVTISSEHFRETQSQTIITEQDLVPRLGSNRVETFSIFLVRSLQTRLGRKNISIQ